MLAVLLITPGLIKDSMLIAIPVSNGLVSGPGEAKEILIFDNAKGYAIAERYENPALTATSSPGIRMIQSLIERDVSVLIVAHIGAHAFEYAKKKLDVYSCTGMSVNEAVSKLHEGRLQKLENELPGDHHNHIH